MVLLIIAIAVCYVLYRIGSSGEGSGVKEIDDLFK
jgi:hypothetical protein